MSFATIPGRNGREASVHSRYANAARAREDSLCCPVRYPREYLKVIPQEILDRDYGCGDPTPYVREGDTVLDLGSGGGKVCYILSQVVGPRGRVIGVDCNPDMLALARGYREQYDLLALSRRRGARSPRDHGQADCGSLHQRYGEN